MADHIHRTKDTVLAAALWNEGTREFRTSIEGMPRAPVCGMGSCFECRVTVDGRQHVRSCLMPANDASAVRTGSVLTPCYTRPPGGKQDRNEAVPTHFPDVCVIGAGPAGLAAATHAAHEGASVLVLDQEQHVGGQVWRPSQAGPQPPAAQWRDRCERAGVTIQTGTTLVDAEGPQSLRVTNAHGAVEQIRPGRLILATGATELLLPFPGWTLPGVMGAGGLQALVKGGLDVRGQRVVVAGSGPLLLAVAAHLRRAGANVVALVEQAPVSRIRRLGLRLLGHPRKLIQALGLMRGLRNIEQLHGAWPVRAAGDGSLSEVVLQGSFGQRTIPCDFLACGFGLVPEARMGALLGCDIDPADGSVIVDSRQQTSISGVLAAGEICGVGGVDLAVAEGAVAGTSAAGRTGGLASLQARRDRELRFARRLLATWDLRKELLKLPEPDTMVCRCEDVPFSSVEDADDTRHAKLQTRCGMGPCQARVCGPALRFLLGWQADRVRPPLVPVSVEALASEGPSADDHA